MTQNQPRLYGINSSNRDFTKPPGWGKNVFNNAFPASLMCYMGGVGINPVYLKLGGADSEIVRDYISVQDAFGIDPTHRDLFFDFEGIFTPYEPLVSSTLPRIDLVTLKLDKDGGSPIFLRGLEIKLTAIPDNTTFDKGEEGYSCELVVRPDSVIYVALNIIDKLRQSPGLIIDNLMPIDRLVDDWSSSTAVGRHLDEIREALNAVISHVREKQSPFLLQPIWKTVGQTLRLEHHCMDVFVWSDLALAKLFIDDTKTSANKDKISRPARASCWLFKILMDFAQTGKFDHEEIKDKLSFGVQTDKAFALSGVKTHQYLKSEELLTPRITVDALPQIILGGGHRMLSPERRFDAAIMNNIALFGEGDR